MYFGSKLFPDIEFLQGFILAIKILFYIIANSAVHALASRRKCL